MLLLFQLLCALPLVLGFIEHKCVKFHRPLYKLDIGDQPLHGFTIATNNETVRFNIVIYTEKERDQTNIPEKAYDNGELDGFFKNLCTRSNKDKYGCEVGKFIIEYKTEEMKGRVMNMLVNRLDHIKADIEDYEKYCYYLMYDHEVPKEEMSWFGKFYPPYHILPNQPLEYYLLSEYSAYFAYTIMVLTELVLVIAIWYFRLRKSSALQRISYPNPLSYLTNILICSIVVNFFHLWYSWNFVNSIYNQNGYLVSNSSQLRYLKMIIEVFEEVFTYLMVYQFVTLQAPSWNFFKKTDFKKTRLRKCFLYMMIWASIIFPIVCYYESFLLFNDFTEAYFETLRKFFSLLNFLDFTLLWFILYRLSQETEETQELGFKSPSFGRTFKLVRIFVTVTAILMKIVGVFIETFFSMLFYDISEWGINYLDHIDTDFSSLFQWVITNVFKILFAVLRNFNGFGSLLLISVAVYIYWNPETYNDKDEGPSTIKSAS